MRINFDSITTGFTGFFAGITLSAISEVLQIVVLLLTIIIMIYQELVKPKKH